MKDFNDLHLSEPLQRALSARNYTHPTPIQSRAIPPLLAGRDVLGCAQTGTGKTAAFALPVLQQLSEQTTRGKPKIRALILSPTRELASQIGESFKDYGRHLPLKTTTIFGGVNETPQIRALRRGVDILVACPGRLLDLQNRGFVDLSAVEFFVLDEADRMLDMGFVPDVRRIMKLMRRERQNLLFSATMPKSVEALAESFLDNPVRIDIAPKTPAVAAIEQKVMFVGRNDKSTLLCELLVEPEVGAAIVFTRTKSRANRLVQQLEKAGIKAAAIHGNKSQNARQRALAELEKGRVKVLVATDVASRGIDVEKITHVINYDLPNDPESYVHRIGRTGRAGRSGYAIAFCDGEEGPKLQAMEKLLGQEIEADIDHRFHQVDIMGSVRAKKSASGRKRSPGSRSRRRNSSGPRRRSKNSTGRGETQSASTPRRHRRNRRPLSERD